MATVSKNRLIERQLLFSSLEALLNADDLQKFAATHPGFLPQDRPDVIPLEARWYRDQARKIWRGDLPEKRLILLLGLEQPDEDVPGSEGWHAVVRELQKRDVWQDDDGNPEPPPPLEFYSTPKPKLTCNWQTGEIRYEFSQGLRRALFELLKDSWRAKVCPNCERYFVADKPAQRHCSPRCYGDTKRKSDREWHRQDRRKLKRGGKQL
jgi:hypothetical protein